MITQIFEDNQKRLKVKCLSIGADLWMHINGETWVISPPKNRKNAKISKDTDLSDEIIAPMPGKILRIQTKVGEAVLKDQVLVVMEAMKMEYSLQAPCSGVVRELMCREMEQVELGKILVSIESK